MKAILCTKSGPPDVLILREIKKPKPKENEVLVKVYNSTVTHGDVILRKMNPIWFFILRFFGVRRKKITGHEFSGKIAEIGSKVKHFSVGDAVIGTTTGLEAGANAEFVCVPENGKTCVLVKKPSGLPFNSAAALPVGGMTAFFILNQAEIKKDDKVLIYGASGSVGSFGVQLAKYFKAEVTAVCSTNNIEMVRSLGADSVIDYKKNDFRKEIKTYDVIFDAVGKITIDDYKESIKEGGVFLTVQKPTQESLDNLRFLIDLQTKGFIKPFIDKTYTLEQIVEAHQYVESGHKRGNVVLAIAE